ncbi:hypothetical protein C8Q80DRAFT_1096937 [Daedaleopsis nitida]|nr:hypothetical protein C8Q80DRAFT_1096937 [Daedaleopsis nitida]
MASRAFPIDEAYLIGGWLESCLWGLFTLLFALSMYSIYKKRHENALRRFTTISIVVLYILATAHISIGLVRLINAFIRQRDTVGPVEYLADISVPLNVAKDWFYITNLFVGDLVVVWRLCVVWGRNGWIAVFPVILVLGELVAGYGAIIQWILPNPSLDSSVQWGTAMFAMSMATNTSVTAVIAARIWYVDIYTILSKRGSSNPGMQGGIRYHRLILLLLESGAFITLAKIIEFILFWMAPGDGLDGNNALYIIYEAMPQITGIVPTVIIYAVNHGYTHHDDCYSTRTVSSTLMFARASKTETGLRDPSSTTTATVSSMTFAGNFDEVLAHREVV